MHEKTSTCRSTYVGSTGLAEAFLVLYADRGTASIGLRVKRIAEQHGIALLNGMDKTIGSRKPL